MAKKILIVDDEIQLVEMVKMRLEAAGYEIISAYDGQEGFDKAKKDKPDLIILDLMLPRMDGYKVCALLKKDARHSSIPIIMFTAYPATIIMEEAEKLGVSSFIPKLSAYTDVAMSLRAAIDMAIKNISGK